MIAALAVTFTVAVCAVIVATWASVADAPWEDDAPPVVVEDGTDDVRCEGALSLRASVIRAGRENPGGGIPVLGEEPSNPGGLRDYDEQLAKAEREIERYC